MKEPESGIEYTISGNSGVPVILLHGFCETSFVWRTVSTQFPENQTVVIPDLPGFGQSVPLEKGFSIDDVAVRIFNWIKNLDFDSFIVVGHSLGGYVALSLAELYPDQVEGLGLFHSSSFEDPDDKKQNRLKAIEFIEKHGVNKFVTGLIPGLFYNKTGLEKIIEEQVEDALKTTLDSAIAYTQAMRIRPNRSEVLKNQQNSLFIAGENDPVVPIEDSLTQIESIDPEYALIVENTGHMGMFESPQDTTKALTNFVRDISNRN